MSAANTPVHSTNAGAEASTARASGPHPDRFRFVACQCAPRVMATEVHEDPNGGATRVVYTCAHEGRVAPHFTVSIGDRQGHRCYVCGIAAASKLPEFVGWFDETGQAMSRGESA